jgi:hypothetical protein
VNALKRAEDGLETAKDETRMIEKLLEAARVETEQLIITKDERIAHLEVCICVNACIYLYMYECMHIFIYVYYSLILTPKSLPLNPNSQIFISLLLHPNLYLLTLTP